MQYVSLRLLFCTPSTVYGLNMVSPTSFSRHSPSSFCHSSWPTNLWTFPSAYLTYLNVSNVFNVAVVLTLVRLLFPQTMEVGEVRSCARYFPPLSLPTCILAIGLQLQNNFPQNVCGNLLTGCKSQIKQICKWWETRTFPKYEHTDHAHVVGLGPHKPQAKTG